MDMKKVFMMSSLAREICPIGRLARKGEGGLEVFILYILPWRYASVKHIMGKMLGFCKIVLRARNCRFGR